MSSSDDNNDQRGGDSGEITSSKKVYTSCEQNNIDNITEGIDSIAILNDVSKCANCGKEGNSSDMNVCNKCQMVKYCNAVCKKKHRKKHKKACEKQAAEIYDEKLFKEVERNECPICLLPLPLDADESTIHSCCGKRICIGCEYAMKMSEGKDLCAFCRAPPPGSQEEDIKRTKNLMDKGNAEAFHYFSGYYVRGTNGIPQDWVKARGLWLKAGELGCSEGYYNLGNSYDVGRGVEVDKKKAKHYFELAAMKGNVNARHNLGYIEVRDGNDHRAMKHWILAARAGNKTQLDNVKKGFTKGLVTKDEYASTLRAYHERQKETKSDERDAAKEYRRMLATKTKFVEEVCKRI